MNLGHLYDFVHRIAEAGLCRKPRAGTNLVKLLVKDQVGHVSPLHNVDKMAEVEGLADQNLEYQN